MVFENCLFAFLFYKYCKRCIGRMIMKVLVTQLCPTLCDPIHWSLQGSFVHGILQARILEWVAIPFSGGSSWPRDWILVSALQVNSLHSEPLVKPSRRPWCSLYLVRICILQHPTPDAPMYAAAAAANSLQSCLTLCDPIDGSSPGSPIPGILHARTLEWVAISFSNAWKW